MVLVPWQYARHPAVGDTSKSSPAKEETDGSRGADHPCMGVDLVATYVQPARVAGGGGWTVAWQCVCVLCANGGVKRSVVQEWDVMCEE